MDPVQLEAGEILFRDGDAGELLYVVSNGELAVTKEVDGQEKELAVLPAGSFVGELSMLNGEPRSATVKARTACTLQVYDRDSFDTLLRRNDVIIGASLRMLWQVYRTGKRATLLVGPDYAYHRALRAGLDRHRVGLTAVWVPGDRWGVMGTPRLFALAGVNAHDPNRAGQPYGLLGVGSTF